MSEEQVTEIIYKNSHDCSEGLVIIFENIQKVIKLLCDATTVANPNVMLRTVK